jgi:hypothetical protein
MSDSDLDGFKKYVHKGRSYTPKVVIRRNGQIAFNSGAIKKYDLDLYKYVILYISEDKKRIAIKFTNNDKESGLIPIQIRSGNFAFSARTFLGLYDIPCEKTINYDFKWDNAKLICYFKF